MASLAAQHPEAMLDEWMLGPAGHELFIPSLPPAGLQSWS